MKPFDKKDKLKISFRESSKCRPLGDWNVSKDLNTSVDNNNDKDNEYVEKED